jgi:primosomal protein N' (replication factor Y)
MKEANSNNDNIHSPLGVGGFAEIIIPLALPKNYTWSVPVHLREQLHVGCRVEVNLVRIKNMPAL